MSFWNQYPYTDFHELNLDWIIKKIKEVTKEMNDFKVVNRIVWGGLHDPGKEYPRFCIVDTPTHEGYISIQPVPAGVTIDNEDYWRQVANYSALYADFQNRIIRLENLSCYAVDNVADMISHDFKVGDYVKTAGYYGINDGGAALYYIRAKRVGDVTSTTVDASTSVDGLILLDTDLVAEIITASNVNAKSFGAKADGVTDDSGVLNTCVAYLGKLGGGVLYLTKGTYFITDHFVINEDNISLIGENKGDVIIKVGAWVDGIRVSDDDYPASTKITKNVYIAHITVDGNRDGYPSNPNDDTYGNGINLNAADYCVVEDCIVKDASGQGIVSTYQGPIVSGNPQNSYIVRGCTVLNTLDLHIAIGCESTSKNCIIEDCKVFGNTAATGIYFGSAGTTIDDNRNTIIRNNVVNNGTTSGHRGTGIFLEDYSNHIIVEGNVIENTAWGIRVAGSNFAITDLLITNNMVYEFSTNGILVFPILTGGEYVVSNNYLKSTANSNDNYAILAAAGGKILSNHINSKSGVNCADDTIIQNNIIYSGTDYSVYSVTAGTKYVIGNYMDKGADVTGAIYKGNYGPNAHADS